jgi:hypothetical protein
MNGMLLILAPFLFILHLFELLERPADQPRSQNRNARPQMVSK